MVFRQLDNLLLVEKLFIHLQVGNAIFSNHTGFMNACKLQDLPGQPISSHLIRNIDLHHKGGEIGRNLHTKCKQQPA